VLGDRYDYEILFIDNKSRDGTREEIERLCAQDKRVKAIFNTRNFGQCNSPYYGLMQTSGDCTVVMSADFQDPPALIPRMVDAWEQGYKIVCMAKTNSHNPPFMRALRAVYYKTVGRLSDIEMVENFMGVGLYDKTVVEAMRGLDDPLPFFSGVVAELGCETATLPYEQAKRRAGKSSNNFFTQYDYAMRSVTAYTKTGPRLATLLGSLVACASFIAALACLILKLFNWYKQPIGLALLAAGLFFLGGVQLFFLGLLGEYIVSIQHRSMKRPLVIEERRLNF
jgi:glycosyltransferase involved in cell wall biosynthesis